MWFSLCIGLELPMCPSAGAMKRHAADPFVVAANQQQEAEHTLSVTQKEPQVENRMEFAHEINPTSYEVFRFNLNDSHCIGSIRNYFRFLQPTPARLAAGLCAHLQNTTSLKCLKGSRRTE